MAEKPLIILQIPQFDPNAKIDTNRIAIRLSQLGIGISPLPDEKEALLRLLSYFEKVYKYFKDLTQEDVVFSSTEISEQQAQLWATKSVTNAYAQLVPIPAADKQELQTAIAYYLDGKIDLVPKETRRARYSIQANLASVGWVPNLGGNRLFEVYFDNSDLFTNIITHFYQAFAHIIEVREEDDPES